MIDRSPLEAGIPNYVDKQLHGAWNRFGQSIFSHVTLDFGDSNLGRYSIRVVNAGALLRWKIAPSRA